MDADLIAIEAPPAPQGMRYVTVLGAGGNTFGLGFFHECEDCYRMLRPEDWGDWFAKQKRGLWQCSFDDAKNTPPDDVDAWAAPKRTL